MLLRPEQWKAKWKAQQLRKVAELRDGYVRSILVARTSLSTADIPSDLISLKRAHIKLARALKQKESNPL